VDLSAEARKADAENVPPVINHTLTAPPSPTKRRKAGVVDEDGGSPRKKRFYKLDEEDTSLPKPRLLFSAR